MSRGDLLKIFNAARTTPDMNPEDRFGPWADQRFYLRGIEIVCLWIDIAEHRGDVFPPEGVGTCDEGKGWEDDFAC